MNRVDEANVLVKIALTATRSDLELHFDEAGDEGFYSHGLPNDAAELIRLQLEAAGWEQVPGIFEPVAGSNEIHPNESQAHYSKYTNGGATVLLANIATHETGFVMEVF